MKSNFEDKNFIDKAIQSFIRPFRLKYNQSDLGPKYNQINDDLFTRQDFQIPNYRNFIMKCSYYTSKNKLSKKIIIFLHGNSGSRLDGKIISIPILLSGFFTFDFCGCGISQGKYITLGLNQSKDLETIYNYVKQNLGYQQIFLWGRSMGAVTAIKFYQQFIHCKIDGIIADSPFKNLRQLSLEVIQDKIFLPKLILSPIVSFIFNKINEEYGIDFQNCEIQKKLTMHKIPTVIITSKQDTLVNHKHSEHIYQTIKAKKKLIYVQGDHNDIRKRQTIQQILQFFKKPSIIQIELKQRPLSNYFFNKIQENISIKKRSISKHDQKVETANFYNFKKKSFSKLRSIPSMKHKFSLRPSSKININPTFIQQIANQNQVASPQFTQKLLPNESINNNSQLQSTTFPFKISNLINQIQQTCPKQICNQNMPNNLTIQNIHIQNNHNINNQNIQNKQHIQISHNYHNVLHNNNNIDNNFFKPVANLQKLKPIRYSLKSAQITQNKFTNSNSNLFKQDRKIFSSFSNTNVIYQKQKKDMKINSQNFFEFKNNINIKPQFKINKSNYHRHSMIRSFQFQDHFQLKNIQFKHNDAFSIHQDISQRRGKYL